MVIVNSSARLFVDEAVTNRPNVTKTIEKFAGRGLDNSFAATYFPDVITKISILFMVMLEIILN